MQDLFSKLFSFLRFLIHFVNLKRKNSLFIGFIELQLIPHNSLKKNCLCRAFLFWKKSSRWNYPENLLGRLWWVLVKALVAYTFSPIGAKNICSSFFFAPWSVLSIYSFSSYVTKMNLWWKVSPAKLKFQMLLLMRPPLKSHLGQTSHRSQCHHHQVLNFMNGYLFRNFWNDKS